MVAVVHVLQRCVGVGCLGRVCVLREIEAALHTGLHFTYPRDKEYTLAMLEEDAGDEYEVLRGEEVGVEEPQREERSVTFAL